MLRFKQFIKLLEELTQDQKKMVDGWASESQPKRITDHVPGFVNGRLELPFSSSSNNSLHPKIESHLLSNGYNIIDNNYVSRKKSNGVSQKMRIGKVLPKDLQDIHAKHQQEQGSKQKEFKIVISKHPYDVAGMSTDRGWTSCMDLNKNHGNASHLPHDIRHGTHVAYLVHKDDSDIKKPIARVALKPFVHTKTGHTVIRPENKVYGTNQKGFLETVKDWTETHTPANSSGVYEKHPDVYDDSQSGGNKFAHYTKDDVDDIFKNRDYERMDELLRHDKKNPHITEKHLTQAYTDDAPKRVKYEILTHPLATEEHINKGLYEKAPALREKAIRNKKSKLSSSYIDDILNGDDVGLKFAVLGHRDASNEHIEKALSDPDSIVKGIALDNSKTPYEHIMKVLDDPDYLVRKNALSHPKVNGDHLTKVLLNDPDHEVRMEAIKHRAANEDHLRLGLDDPHNSVRRYAKSMLGDDDDDY